MKLSDHAKFKLEIYNISELKIINTCRMSAAEYFDKLEGSHIKIIEIQKKLFAVVYNKESQLIITVYKTDLKTIKNRQKIKDGFNI
ncbi:MAG: hypothetical protein A3H98_10575 [Bacteroidetes bacterium RIFCSPLOWO2_02_FULL_36_8]|nr:MAG: hypothetical protein A3H98_10575 [Bacteroidetes bacterium RIFCSPLOWO2_02_FULL_36_8]OFY70007.1 MAG: hypothetical protein A3G23_01120 [Bacteroidetes bacterium RIFCSPLOWO2_12_FULL_37_12]